MAGHGDEPPQPGHGMNGQMYACWSHGLSGNAPGIASMFTVSTLLLLLLHTSTLMLVAGYYFTCMAHRNCVQLYDYGTLCFKIMAYYYVIVFSMAVILFSDAECCRIKGGGFPMVVLHGRHDLLAEPRFGEALAKRLTAPFMLLEGAHFIVRECAAHVSFVLGHLILGRAIRNSSGSGGGSSTLLHGLTWPCGDSGMVQQGASMPGCMHNCGASEAPFGMTRAGVETRATASRSRADCAGWCSSGSRRRSEQGLAYGSCEGREKDEDAEADSTLSQVLRRWKRLWYGEKADEVPLSGSTSLPDDVSFSNID